MLRRTLLIGAVIFAVGLSALALALRPHWTAELNSGCEIWNASADLVISLRWKGPCKDGKASGRGTLEVFENGKPSHSYEGYFADGHTTGRGVVTWARGSKRYGLRYEGDIVDGGLTGHGVYVFTDGSRYEGDVVDGAMTGHGVQTWADGSRYDGQWVNNQRSGRGFMTYADSSRYDGDWLNDAKTGYGVRTWPDGSRYDGQWTDDRPNGAGTLSLRDRQVYSGKWTNGCFRQASRWANAVATKAECGF
jgi:hypothetical protein